MLVLHADNSNNNYCYNERGANCVEYGRKTLSCNSILRSRCQLAGAGWPLDVRNY